MTKEETAEQIAKEVWDYLREKKFISEAWEQYGILVKGDLANIAAKSIEEFMGYVAKGTLRND